MVITDYKGQKNQHFIFDDAYEELKSQGMVPRSLGELNTYTIHDSDDDDDAGIPDGKFFLVQSKLNDLVLEVQDGSTEPGSFVVTGQRGRVGEMAHQLWYADPATGCIRNRKTEFVLDLDDENVAVVNPFSPGRKEQMWGTASDRVHMQKDHIMILEIADANESPGATVVAAEWARQENQRWEINHMPSIPFWIVSEMSGMCMDVAKANREPGASVVTYKKDMPLINQMWYEDSSGIIRSGFNDFPLTQTKGSTPTIKLYPDEHGHTGQHWIFNGNTIVNSKNPKKVLDIKGESKKSNKEITVTDFKKKKSQYWKMEIATARLENLGISVSLGDDDESD